MAERKPLTKDGLGLCADDPFGSGLVDRDRPAGAAAEIRRVEMVGPQVGKDLREKALLAIFFALTFIAIYISGRFEFKWAQSGLVAVVLGGAVYGLYTFGVSMPLIILAALIVTWQAPAPVQAPPQPVKTEPVAGAAVRVTGVPWPYASEQSEPQLMPTGEDVTVPAPVPAFVTVKVYALRAKVAVTDLAASMVTEQDPVPVQAPLQPAKVDPVAAEAFNVTTVPGL